MENLTESKIQKIVLWQFLRLIQVNYPHLKEGTSWH